MDYKIGADNYVLIREFRWNYDQNFPHLNREDTEYLNNGYSILELDSVTEDGLTRLDKSDLNQIDYHEVWLNGDPTKPIFYKPFSGFKNLLKTCKTFRHTKPTETLIKGNEKFIYLIDNSIFEKYKSIKIPEQILHQIKLGNVVVVINSANEPYSFEPIHYTNQLISLGNRYNLNKTNFKVLTGDQKPIEIPDLNFEFIPYNYFLDFPWFINLNAEASTKRLNQHQIENSLFLKRMIDRNREITFKRVGLCYQRRAHSHRRVVMYEFYHDEIVRDNIFMSFWNESRTQFQSYEPFGYSTKETVVMNDFFKDFRENLNFDDCDLSQNQASGLEVEAHKETFVSIVSETRYFNSLFFSEKTFKPIYCLQPFIIINANGSLEHLKNLGFQTFNKWWDESYDEAPTLRDKLQKIKDIIKRLSKLSDKELHDMYQEMEPILIHNYNHFTDLNRLELHGVLQKIYDEI